jgi:hypothetical protein
MKIIQSRFQIASQRTAVCISGPIAIWNIRPPLFVLAAATGYIKRNDQYNSN